MRDYLGVLYPTYCTSSNNFVNSVYNPTGAASDGRHGEPFSIYPTPDRLPRDAGSAVAGVLPFLQRSLFAGSPH